MKIKMISAAALLVASSFGYAETLQTLPKDKVMEVLKGNTVTTLPIITMNNEQISNTWVGYFGEDGKVSAKITTPSTSFPPEDNGTWTVDDNGALCISWQKWMAEANTKACAYLYEVKNGYILVNQQDGNFESVLKKDSVKGNQVK